MMLASGTEAQEKVWSTQCLTQLHQTMGQGLHQFLGTSKKAKVRPEEAPNYKSGWLKHYLI